MATLKADLEATGLELMETHISWVFLAEDEVFKVKKPVSFRILHYFAFNQILTIRWYLFAARRDNALKRIWP